MPTYKVIGGDQKPYGPVTDADLRQWIAEGRLNGQSLAQAEDSAEWKPLAAFPEFADALYVKPVGVPPAATPKEWTNQILAREPELHLGECLSGGLSFLTANAGFALGA